jgi:hypothetical protein
MTAKKINLEDFISMLTSVWERGVDYIDLKILENNVINLSIEDDYFSEEVKSKENFMQDLIGDNSVNFTKLNNDSDESNNDDSLDINNLI